MKHRNLISELAAKAKVDERSAEQMLRALGMNDDFDQAASRLGHEVALKDLRLGFKVGRVQVAV